MSEKFASEFSVQLVQLLDQAIDKIENCLDQLTDAQIWWRPDTEMNSIGNLLLHISGNLQQWCVAELNNQVDCRDRAREFQTQSMPREDLMRIVNAVVKTARRSIFKLRSGELSESICVQGFRLSRMNALLHTVTHFQGHTHQIILMTRLQKKDSYRFHWSEASDRRHVPM